MSTTYSSAEAIDITTATIDALQARFKTLANIIDIVSAERVAIDEALRKRTVATNRISNLIKNLSKDEKEVFRQVVNSPEFLGVGVGVGV